LVCLGFFVLDVAELRPRLGQDRGLGMPLQLMVTSGAGGARTSLAAFDAALFDAGIANFNLIRLSSVIPAESLVLEKRPSLPASQWGWRLHVVLAQQLSCTSGESAWAGIGWIQDEASGRGLFVEHEAGSEAEAQDLIEASLDSMRSYRDDTFGSTRMVTRGVRCTGAPVCAVVAVVYSSVPW
jgi:arginine decarboxylase